MIHVGCDADQFARDIKRWIDRGWVVAAAGGDRLFFPGTPHVESLAFLVKNQGAS